MKNLFFTVIALIAFSATNFATTAKETEQIPLEVNIPPSTVDNCLKAATYLYEYYIDDCGWPETEGGMFLNYLSQECYK